MTSEATPTDPPTNDPPRDGRALRIAEWAVAVALVGLALRDHVAFVRRAGSLWRDEAGTLGVATLPTLGEVWANQQHEAFLMLWNLLLRAWALHGPGASAGSLRTLGLLVGVALTASLFVAGRLVAGRRPPIVALALVGVCGMTVVQMGDAVRGYGLGAALVVLTAGLAWRVASGDAGRAGVAALAVCAIAASHVLFFNAILLAAAFGGAMAVAVVRRRWRAAGALASIGMIAAASAVPYVAVIRRGAEWNRLVRFDFDLPLIWAYTVPIFEGLWSASIAWTAAGVGLAAAVGAMAVSGWRSRLSPTDRDRILFAAIVATLAVVGYAVLFLQLGYAPRQWYFVPLIALLAVCVQACAAIVDPPAGRWALIGAVAIAVIGFRIETAGRPALRFTNVDAVADRLAAEATPGDLVVVGPWQFGVSFTYHYRGAAPWTTLPAIDDHRFHRYDLIKARMLEPDPIAPLLARIESTLRAGGRVYYVGELVAPPRGVAPLRPPVPTAQDPSSWAEVTFAQAWGEQVGDALRTHAAQVRDATPAMRPGEAYFEAARLYVAEGWR